MGLGGCSSFKCSLSGCTAQAQTASGDPAAPLILALSLNRSRWRKG